jgi:hypothetical protein
LEIKPHWVRHLRRSLEVRSLNFSQRLLRVSAAVLQAISNCFAGLDAAQHAWLSAGCEPLPDFLNCFYLSFVFGEQREGEPVTPIGKSSRRRLQGHGCRCPTWHHVCTAGSDLV